MLFEPYLRLLPAYQVVPVSVSNRDAAVAKMGTVLYTGGCLRKVYASVTLCDMCQCRHGQMRLVRAPSLNLIRTQLMHENLKGITVFDLA